MSALICGNFCFSKSNNLPYFGTEDSWECYCGYDNETNKLNNTYNWYETQECSSSCQGHEYEKCGKSARISTYTTKTEQKDSILKVEEVLMQKCRFNSSLNNIIMSSYQRTNQCEPDRIKNYSGYNCDVNSCWVKQMLPFSQGYLADNLPKYVTINYTCKVPENKENNILQSGYAKEKGDFIGIAIGILIGVIVICSVLVGLYLIKRNRLKDKDIKAIDKRTNNMSDQESVVYENVQRSNHVYSNGKGLEGKNIYSVVNKANRINKNSIEEDNPTFSSPDDVYVDIGDDVYDIANKPRDKHKKDDQVIYSHTTEDVYDSTTTNDPIPKNEENAYDQGFHQPRGYKYDMSNS